MEKTEIKTTPRKRTTKKSEKKKRFPLFFALIAIFLFAFGLTKSPEIYRKINGQIKLKVLTPCKFNGYNTFISVSLSEIKEGYIVDSLRFFNISMSFFNTYPGTIITQKLGQGKIIDINNLPVISAPNIRAVLFDKIDTLIIINNYEFQDTLYLTYHNDTIICKWNSNLKQIQLKDFVPYGKNK